MVREKANDALGKHEGQAERLDAGEFQLPKRGGSDFTRHPF
jgi:hypothetical protein